MNTIVTKWINQEAVGYMINAKFSPDNQEKISLIQKSLASQFPDILWIAPKESLHITLMDWIAPLVDYKKNKDKLYEEVHKAYDSTIEEILTDQKSLEIEFSELKVSETAIILVGKDNGIFRKIRQSFLAKVDLLPETKRPPQIIHSTICRYQKEFDLIEIKLKIENQPVNTKQRVEEFRLVRESKLPMLEFKIVKEYKLK